eukprot:CAMPEP_0201589628 /NCGR_PEP_ID=MMETSP0190_2-20130828/169015_1 /ASSEMBLY_ACC=CAM_ASM_000263 /TAXON_ID=37353 /ORGANISM="Rosalina sp." /LENGTH=186 /DNA_ID=CAMNT_0048044203 /DNA_START=103 /DNA_END=659 /DNA_ORIENTATION=+
MTNVMGDGVGYIKPEATGNTASINCGSGKIGILGAIYGGNCPNGGYRLDESMKKACDGKSSCSYTVNYRVVGDACPFVAKDFFYGYTCQAPGSQSNGEGRGNVGYISPEASRIPSVSINCLEGFNIRVVGSIYGANCPRGTGSDRTNELKAACNGKNTCNYKAKVSRDPCPGVRKDYQYAYQCIKG